MTKDILFKHYSQFSHSHPPSSLPPCISVSNCADVHNEWWMDTIVPDLQVHILTAIHGSKTSLNPMHRILSNLDIEHQPSDPLRVLREKLQAYILTLRNGKHVEREQQSQYEKTTRFSMRSWSKFANHGRNLSPSWWKTQLSSCFVQSDALITFTYASYAKPVPLVSQCSLSLDMFNTENIKRPDCRLDDDLVLGHYKWLHSDL
jgi:hypothetical protein